MDAAFEYARRKRIHTYWEKAVQRFREAWPDFPDEHGNALMGMLTAFRLFGSRKTTAAFARSASRELSDDELSLLKRWRRNPWTFCAFSVRGSLNENRFEIEVIGPPPADREDSYFSEPAIL